MKFKISKNSCDVLRSEQLQSQDDENFNWKIYCAHMSRTSRKTSRIIVDVISIVTYRIVSIRTTTFIVARG